MVLFRKRCYLCEQHIFEFTGKVVPVILWQFTGITVWKGLVWKGLVLDKSAFLNESLVCFKDEYILTAPFRHLLV